MADFKTHMLGAALVSGVATTGLAMVSDVSDGVLLGYFSLGIVGGILPDVDSEVSIPVRIAFNVLSVVAVFGVVFHFSEAYSLTELVLLGGLCFFIVRYGVFHMFARFTVHRGLFHTIPAGAIAGIVTAIIGYRLFDAQATQAWTWGAFIFGGFIIHLLLDEIYSVDLSGMRLKRSFGTALSLGSFRDPLGTVSLYLLLAAMFYFSPPHTEFLDLVTDNTVYQALWQRLLPEDVWFPGLFEEVLELPEKHINMQ